MEGNITISGDVMLLCSQAAFGDKWYSVAGLLFDIVGVGILALDVLALSREQARITQHDVTFAQKILKVSAQYHSELDPEAELWIKELETISTSPPSEEGLLRAFALRMSLNGSMIAGLENRVAALQTAIDNIIELIANRDIDRRTGALTSHRRTEIGLGIIVVGFLLQAFGAWPCP